MNLTNAPLGYAFEGDYPESYGADEGVLRDAVAVQVGTLAGTTPEHDARLLGILIGRRGGDQSRAQLEMVTRRDGSRSLMARGEVMMSADAWSAAGVAGFGADFEPRKVGGHMRLRRPRGCRTQVDDFIARCGKSDIDAWPNYLSTMAAVGKGIGGPENAPPLPPFVVPNGPQPGRSIQVAVIDTGIPAAVRGDGWLADVPRTGSNVDELDVFPGGVADGLLDYQAGHGTFVAGIVARVAPTAVIRVYRVADSDGFATDDDIAAAIVQAHRDGAEVINLSLGTRTLDDAPPQLMAQAVQTVHDEAGRDRRGRGHKVIIAAAGNFGDSGHVWPAGLPGVEAVAGLTPGLKPAPWSSYGAVRFSAVGEGIRSVYVEGQESPVFDPEPDVFGPDPSAIWSGTSFAAPQVAGAVARIVAERPDVTPRRAVDMLDERGKPIPGFGKAMKILQGIS